MVEMTIEEAKKRFDELKVKGFVTLVGEERKEYQDLKKRLVVQQNPIQTVTVKQIPNDLNDLAKKEEPTITMTKSALLKMIDEIKNDKQNTFVDKDLEWQEYTAPKERTHTATFRVYQKDADSPKGIVVDIGRLRFDLDEITKRKDVEIHRITVKYDDGRTELVEMPIGEFIKINEFEIVEIVKIKERKLKKSEGLVMKSKVTKDDTGMEMILGEEKTGEKIDAIVLKDDPICTIRRKNGQEFEVNANRLNM